MGNNVKKLMGDSSPRISHDNTNMATDDNVHKYFHENETFKVSGCVNIEKLMQSLGIDPKIYVSY